MNKDTLYKIFSRQLAEYHNISERSQEFIRKVVHLYTLQLTKIGNIPLQVMDDVMSELEQEVVEMYRKKTYGFITLEDYRRHAFRQNDDL
jgi:hypothetical protein